jgi:hypothetical protein
MPDLISPLKATFSFDSPAASFSKELLITEELLIQNTAP